jgi:uncharacterized protein (DUF302 family)
MDSPMPAEKMIEMITLKMESDLSIEKIADKVEEACKNHSFVLLQTYKYHEIVEEKGFPITRKVFIYNVCQAKTAAMMLTSNPEFSIFMPCTLSIYENNGKTTIAAMNMELLLPAVKSDAALYNQASNLFSSFRLLMNYLATGN